MAIAAPPPAAVIYPEEDGKLTESTKHLTQLTDLYVSLRHFFAPRPDVFVGGNIALFYQEGDPGKYYGPDILVAFGVRPRPMEERSSYRLWEEGVVPQVIIELLSPKTGQADMVQKPPKYAALGVEEYYLFDPLNVFMRPPLRGYHMNVQGRYDRLGGTMFDSPALRLRLVEQAGWLRLIDLTNGNLLPIPAESYAAYQELQVMRAEWTRMEDELERERAARQAAQAAQRQAEADKEAERLARRASDAEITRLREEIARLRSANGLDRDTRS